MDKYRRDLVRRLFTLATEILENSHHPISKGQAGALAAREYRLKAHRLAKAGAELKALSGAILAALGPDAPKRLR